MENWICPQDIYNSVLPKTSVLKTLQGDFAFKEVNICYNGKSISKLNVTLWASNVLEMYPEATPWSFLAAAALILRAVNHGQRRGNVTLRSNADRNFEFACFAAVAYQGLCSAIEGGVTLCLMDCRVCTEPKLPPKPHHSRAPTPKCSPFHCVGLHIQQLTGTILESTLKASNQSLHNLQLLIEHSIHLTELKAFEVKIAITRIGW